MIPKNVVTTIGKGALALALFTGLGCSVFSPTPAGREGEACGTGFTTPTRCRGDHLTCRSGRCVAAGRADQPCIEQSVSYVPVPPMCDGGLLCDGTLTCRASCGQSGQRCCGSGLCGAGLSCNSGTCRPPSSTACYVTPGPGLSQYIVPLMDAGRCVGGPSYYTTYAGSQSTANTCATNAFASGGLRVDDSNDPPISRRYCFHTMLGASVTTLSVRRADRWNSCVQFWCNESNRCRSEELTSDAQPCVGP